jgi:DNA-binding transcriptional LysR family regulator
LVDAREALRHVEQAFARAQQAERGELGRIELGFMTWVAGSGMLHNWMDPFEQAHPAIEINLHRTGPVAAINRMMDGELDVCFTRAPSKYPSGIRGFELYRQRFALALPRQHPLAKHDAIDLGKLAGERFINITPEVDIGFFGYTEAVARIGKFVPQVVKRNTEFITVLAYVAGGKGIAVVPELMKGMNFANVVFREIAGDSVPYASVAFVYSISPSPSARLLIQYMQRYALRNGGKGAPPPPGGKRPKGVAKRAWLAS